MQVGTTVGLVGCGSSMFVEKRLTHNPAAADRLAELRKLAGA